MIVSIEQESYTVTEGETLEVCVLVVNGSLSQNLTVDLSISCELIYRLFSNSVFSSIFLFIVGDLMRITFLSVY